jgi:hypothetical protein
MNRRKTQRHSCQANPSSNSGRSSFLNFAVVDDLRNLSYRFADVITDSGARPSGI